MRVIPYIKGDITTEIPDLNVNYQPLFAEMNIKGQVFGIGEDGRAVKMVVDRSHTIRAIIVTEYCLLENMLFSYLAKTNGNAFLVVHPVKEEWFRKTLEYKGCKTQDVLDEMCDNYSGP